MKFFFQDLNFMEYGINLKKIQLTTKKYVLKV